MSQNVDLRGVQRLLGVLALCAGLCVPGCGGGVDSGGTGITQTTLAIGPISGFGSIVMAGVHYDESAATISDDDGQPLSPNALTLGAVIRIDAGEVVNTGTRLQASAQAIHVAEVLVGPVESVDLAAGTLVVLGQRVGVTPGTAFDSALAGGLSAVHPGRVLAIFGLLDTAGGRVVATRIEPRAGASVYVLRGAVGGFDRTSQQLTVNGQAVSLASIETLPTGLVPGVVVRLKLRTSASNGVWAATDLRVDSRALPDRSNVEIEGRVSAFTSAQRFSVDGVPVDAAAATFSGSGLALGVRVEVEGSSSGGTLVARRVHVDAQDGGGESAIELEGRITSVDTANKTFVVRGVTVSYAASPVFIVGTAADLAIGRSVNTKGQWSADRSVVVARSVHLEL